MITKLRDNLYIGNWESGRATDREYRAMGVTAVLNVAFELSDAENTPDIVKMIKVGLMDNKDNPPEMKQLAVDVAKRLLENGDTVIIHCNAGMSRSMYTCVMAISEIEGVDHHEIWNEFKQKHPFAMWGPLFEGANARYYPDAEEHEEKKP